ncbi:MAG: hypothetical protein ACXAC5_11325 [Promethearchaeota archaeon]|jgi:hypothetical protein
MIMQFVVSGYSGAVILLLITGIAAILFGLFMVLDFVKNKKIHHLLWAISFIVLFVAGIILIITDNYGLLLTPLVAALAVLIPGGIAAGLFFVVFEEKTKLYGYIYLVFVLVMVVLVGIVKVVDSPGDSATVMLAHIPSSLSIILLPIYTTFKTNETDWKALLMTIGGFVISVAGVLLAFLTAGSTLFSAELIFTLLPWVLLLTAIFFAFGMLLPEKWSFAIPGIKK